MQNPKVVLVATGGTIASRYDPVLGRTVASQRAEDLVALLPSLPNIATLELDNYSTISSFDMSLDFAAGLAAHVNNTLDRDDVTGVVVTQGTDTMEETCYLADLLMRSDKPVVFTGAQKAHDDPQPDGPANILDAVRVAVSADAREMGALLCFNGQVHAARDVTKVHASAVQTFQSYDHGALGAVDKDHVVIDRRPRRHEAFCVQSVEERVVLLRLTLGFDAALIDAAVSGGAVGLVIEAFGRGNGPSSLTAAVRRAVETGVALVITSRCPAGRVMPIYGGGGGGRDLEDAGVIFAGDLQGPKARVLLAVALAGPDTRGRLHEIFAERAP